MRSSNNVITLADVRAKRNEILRAAAKHGAKHAYLFGSVARADARANSDVDFLVEFAPGRDVADLSELTLDLEEILERDVHVVDAASLDRVREGVSRDATPLCVIPEPSFDVSPQTTNRSGTILSAHDHHSHAPHSPRSWLRASV